MSNVLPCPPLADLTPEQAGVLDGVIDAVRRRPKRPVTVGGLAGTGKTVLVAELARRLPGFAVCTPTGRAAEVLRNRGTDAATIHSTVYDAHELPGGGVEFTLKDPDAVDCAGFIIDEASMVATREHRSLVSFGRPVIYVGDHGQLAPVGDDPGLMRDPDFRLEKVHRHAGAILHFAAHARAGKPAHAFGSRGPVRVVTEDDLTEEGVLAADQLLCAFHRTRVVVNARVRQLLGRSGTVAVGDRVVCLRNARRVRLYNGVQGVVTALHAGWPPRLDLALAGGGARLGVAYNPAAFGVERLEDVGRPDDPVPFDFAYCVTAHKAQGGEWDHVLVLEQHCQKWDHARWAYTAATRARERLTWVGG
jgi:exodeoxyribonuclease-5